MSHASTLDDIAAGDERVEIARSVIAAALRAPTANTAAEIYFALRSWVWKALDNRRRDSELRDWHDLLKRVESYFSVVDDRIAAQVSALHELVYESIEVAETITPEVVMERSHASDIVSILAEAPDVAMQRSELLERLGLRQANLSRILRLMFAAGIAERVPAGKHVVVRLGAEGRRLAASRAEKRIDARQRQAPSVMRVGSMIPAPLEWRRSGGIEKVAVAREEEIAGYLPSRFSSEVPLESDQTLDRYRPIDDQGKAWQQRVYREARGVAFDVPAESVRNLSPRIELEAA